VVLLTLRNAAARLGIAPDTLRAQIQRGRLIATKLGRDWLVEEAEVTRYARTTLGRSGRRAQAEGPTGRDSGPSR
jgi:excisionase family DNA binding protein